MFVYITSLVTVLAIVGGCIGIYKLYYSLPKNISPKLKGGYYRCNNCLSNNFYDYNCKSAKYSTIFDS